MTPVRTQGGWIGPPERPLSGWLSHDPDRATSSGVLVVPPVGYEWWTAHRTLRTVAERLAAAGHVVLRLDLDGTADAAGDQWDHARVAAWRHSLGHGARALRALGCERLTIVGVRLGALLAAAEATPVGASGLVLWAPVTSGRRAAKELRLLGTEVPGPDGSVTVAGCVFSGETLAEIGTLDVRRLEPAPAVPVTLVGEGLEGARAALGEAGVAVRCLAAAGSELALGRPAEEAAVPPEVVEAVVTAVGAPEAARLSVSALGGAEARIPWRDGEVVERFVRFDRGELAGVLTLPATGEPPTTTLLWLNSGSEPHVGPGRAWVEYARTLAHQHGVASVRLDFSGWGESADRGHAPGRPYDAHCVAEARTVAAELRAMGHERVVLAGLCAGAWIALRAALEGPVDGVFALNPQLYWQPGDPVEALMSDTRQRRAPERARERRGRRLGWWSLLDRAGRRPPAGHWLDALARTRVPVMMAFAEGDDGLEYLHTRLGRRLAAHVRRSGLQIRHLGDIDHSMHRTWLRDRVVAAAGGFVEGLR